MLLSIGGDDDQHDSDDKDGDVDDGVGDEGDDSDNDDQDDNCDNSARPVELADQAEFDAMQTFLDPASTDQYWVGLTWRPNSDKGEFFWSQHQSKPPESMWFSDEPNNSGQCVRMTWADNFRRLTRSNIPDTGCLLADHGCHNLYSVICEKDAIATSNNVQQLPNYTYTHISKLNTTESQWRRAASSSKVSRLECAAACTSQLTSGSCGAFVYNSTAASSSGESCVLFSTDSLLTEAISTEHYAQLYIAMLDLKCE
ncbi:hypothetical protein ElyMa_005290200 [Elysia marginata]|uniref:C-type lectin domain-containing protein n=1 Tax=Elysia marginata TaxID=1093978 RepID=A0AAV4JY33_9GAST|nr:hypothetical protein ElyMa_005290200 [Elysia marginata]